MDDQPHTFTVGDRVLIHGGYDGEDSDWLRGGPGYPGTIRKLTANAAAVELDAELELQAQLAKWRDFDRGSKTVVREVDVARGRWLALMHGWAGQTWSDPARLQVGLCAQEPDLYAIPEGGASATGSSRTPASRCSTRSGRVEPLSRDAVGARSRWPPK